MARQLLITLVCDYCGDPYEESASPEDIRRMIEWMRNDGWYVSTCKEEIVECAMCIDKKAEKDDEERYAQWGRGE